MAQYSFSCYESMNIEFLFKVKYTNKFEFEVFFSIVVYIIKKLSYLTMFKGEKICLFGFFFYSS